jgi:hypothetical protein
MVGYDRFPTLFDSIEQRIEAHNREAEIFNRHARGSMEDLQLDKERRERGGTTSSDLDKNEVLRECDVQEIRSAFGAWSNAIRFDQYHGIVPKARCCPGFWSTIRQYW